MNCPRKSENMKKCNCSYEPCSNKGTCCECLRYHLAMKQLPACCFPDDIESSYDRSFKKFIEVCRTHYGIQ